MTHEKTNDHEDCLFCKIVNGVSPSTKVYEDDNFIGILNVPQKIVGHTLLIPKKHFRNLFDMPSTLCSEMHSAIKKISLDMIASKKAEGINIHVNNEPSAGQVIFHTHIHIVPRKSDDCIKSFV